MAAITRSVAIELLYACGFPTAGALSTQRLQKKINRLDRVSIDWKSMNTDQQARLDFVLEAINNDVSVEVKEDRKNVPLPERTPQQHAQITKRHRIQKHERRAAKYDWASILSGKLVQLVQGEDYTCTTMAFAMQVRSVAKRRKIKVNVAARKGFVVVQALG